MPSALDCYLGLWLDHVSTSLTMCLPVCTRFNSGPKRVQELIFRVQKSRAVFQKWFNKTVNFFSLQRFLKFITKSQVTGFIFLLLQLSYSLVLILYKVEKSQLRTAWMEISGMGVVCQTQTDWASCDDISRGSDQFHLCRGRRIKMDFHVVSKTERHDMGKNWLIWHDGRSFNNVVTSQTYSALCI